MVLTQASYSPDDSVVAVGSVDGSVFFWDTYTEQMIAGVEEKTVDCAGLKVNGAKGLDAGGFWLRKQGRAGSLGDWWRSGGRLVLGRLVRG